MKFEINYTLPDGMKCSDSTFDMATAVVHWREVIKNHPDAEVRLNYLGLKKEKQNERI